MPRALEISDVKRYPTGIEALRDVAVAIEETLDDRGRYLGEEIG